MEKSFHDFYELCGLEGEGFQMEWGKWQKMMSLWDEEDVEEGEHLRGGFMSFQKFKVMYGFGEVCKEMGLKGKIRGKIEYPLVI